MSADPVTMFVMTAAKTVMDIKESRERALAAFAVTKIQAAET